MRNKSFVTLTVASLILLVFILLPPIAPITPLGMRVIGIFGFTMTLWLFEGIGYPSILAITLTIILGVMPLTNAFAISLGNNLTIFIIGAFGLAEALRITGFSRRFAIWFISRPFTAGRPWMLVTMFLFATWLMGCFTSGSATCITFMTVAEPMLLEMGYKKGEKVSAMIMSGVAWVATVAFFSTPIGHGSNLMFIDWIKRDTGYVITFQKWIAVGFPLAFIFLLSIIVYFRLVIRPDMSRFRDAAAKWSHEETVKMGPTKPEEKIAFGTFLVVIAIWLIPGFLTGVAPGFASYLNGIGVTVPPLVASCLLCAIKIKEKPVISFKQWMTGVPWEVVALLGAIYVIADGLANKATGIGAFFSQTFAPIATNSPFFVYRAIAQIWVLLQTNLMSNTISAATVYQALMPTAIVTKIGNPVALGFAIWVGARAAFATPSATTNTAIVTGTGWVPIPFLLKHGTAVSCIAAVLSLFVVYPWAAFIFK